MVRELGPVEACTTYDPVTEPWVAQFDVNVGVHESPRGIYGVDLITWASYAIDPKDQSAIPASAYCGLFRVDMLRQKFLAQSVLPEARRNKPIDDSKRYEAISALKDSEASVQKEVGRYAVDTNPATNPTNPYHACDEAHSADPDPTRVNSASTRCLTGVAAFITVVQLKIGMAQQETLTSFDSRERSTLAGCGILFDKKDGQPAEVLSLRPGAKILDKDLVGSQIVSIDGKATIPMTEEEVGKYLVGSQIVSIDGKDTTPMTYEEVRANLRGPLDTEVTLVIRLADGGSKAVKIKRALFSIPFSNKGYVKEENI